MSYTVVNYQTKKALTEAVKAGVPVRVKPEPMSGCVPTGKVYLEGPHYPQPHRWYAQVEVTDGLVTKVKS